MTSAEYFDKALDLFLMSLKLSQTVELKDYTLLELSLLFHLLSI